MNNNKFGALQISIILLTAATAIIHLFLAYGIYVELGLINSLQFIANGLGYLALVTALYLPQFKNRQNLIRWILIAYTLVTILAWVVIGDKGPLGYIDKLIEVALVILLFIEGRQKS